MKMDKKVIGFDAMLQVTTEILLNITTGKLSTIQLFIISIKNKLIKLKGKLKLLKLSKSFAIIAKSIKI